MDEAGMSPLAGPVSAAAVILRPGTRIVGVDDSKKLDAAAREELATEIKEKAASWCVAFVEVEEIDAVNIYWAGIRAMQRAVEGLASTPQHSLIDAKRLKEIGIPQQAIIKGDAKSASIAAASILAKVERDAVMRMLDARHPGYGFADHKGYPVKEHYTALDRLGACAAHRRSFGPVRKALGLPPLPPKEFCFQPSPPRTPAPWLRPPATSYVRPPDNAAANPKAADPAEADACSDRRRHDRAAV
jgi:ribonuclease HII